MRLSRALLALTLALALSAPVEAAKNKKKAVSAENLPPLLMVTGPDTGTYIQIGNDIKKIAEKAGVRIMVTNSDGSIDNIKRITGKSKAALGIVQSDVLGFLSRSKNPDSVKASEKLRVILPLYPEEVHVLARRNIASFEDLKGKKVVVGEEGSGHMLTAVNLLSMMDVKVADTLKMSPPEGVVAVLKGDADAVIIVGGKPIKLFKNLEDLKTPENQKFAPLLANVHFLPMSAPRMLEEYAPAQITSVDYSFVTETVPTLAVTSVLVTYDFSNTSAGRPKDRCKQVHTLAETLRKSLDELKQTGHAKWKEVNFDQELNVWQKDVCAWPNLAGKKQVLNQDLLGIVGKH